MAKKMRSVMSHNFNQIPHADIQRSKFDRSSGYKTTFDAGFLIPFFVDEALPGDTFNLKSTLFARLATPLKPFMDNLFLETFFFAVPNRLLWDNWQKFNGEQDNPADSTDFLIPQMTPQIYVNGQTADYFGIPTHTDNPIIINALHHRAYDQIFNEWFRDQNLQNSRPKNTGDGPDDATQHAFPLRRGKRHDYFTSCLPWPQKGEAVTVPIGGFAPVIPDGDIAPTFRFDNASTGTLALNPSASADLGARFTGASQDISAQDALWLDSGLIADLSSATSITINALRESFQIQKLYERDARGGSRYTEIIKSHFGVTSPDSRLQRPEYLGGGSTRINVNAVAQTSETNPNGDPTVETPQGNLAAMGTATAHNHGFSKSFTEHCVLIGLVNVRADITYQQGKNRMWDRQTRFDFYWPALSHIGEQEVKNSEIYSDGSAADDEIFGYQERYAEYRYKPSMITGKFRSIDAQSLDYWHLSQEFGELPTLSGQFIEDNPPIERVIAVQNEPHFLLDCHHSLTCVRPMPAYSVPGLIDHF